MNIIVVHGPNLNLLGEREPEIYGSMTLTELNEQIERFAQEMKVAVQCFQSNHEGALVDFIHEHRKGAQGIVINPGALTHYSYVLRDAIAAVNIPTVEVHLSNIHERESFRKISVIKDVCEKQIVGMGPQGYFRAIEFLVGDALFNNFKKFVEEHPEDKDAILKEAVRILKEGIPKYTWVGIYLLEGNELVLHNYIGRPTPHTRIPLDRGICGAAAREKQTIIVEDVSKDPRYLACSLETRSEIVVPIQTGEKVLGEIDIDSDYENIFHEIDQEILEKFASYIARFLS